MIELRWLRREVKNDKYRASREYEIVLQYREGEMNVTWWYGTEWKDVLVVDESSVAPQRSQEEK